MIDGKAGDTPCIGTKNGIVTNDNTTQAAVPARGFVCDLAKNVWCNEKSSACEATLSIGDACAFDDFDSCGANAECGSADKCVAKTPTSQAPTMDPSLFLVCSTMN